MSKRTVPQAPAQQMVLDLENGIPLDFGHGIRGHMFGGRYAKYLPTRRLAGVKMAAEIDMECDISIPTEDFSVPSVDSMQAGLTYALAQLRMGNDLYVGCMGGVGRTGLFVGCMLKASHDWDIYNGWTPRYAEDPVREARRVYISHAIETSQQMDYVRGFDTGPVINALLADFVPKVKTVETLKVVEKEVIKEVYLTPFDWAARLFFGKK